MRQHLLNNMDRLNFDLPDFCRVSWASEEARRHWSPVFERLQRFWTKLEFETVRLGMRRVALIASPFEALQSASDAYVAAGFSHRRLYAMSPLSGYISDQNPANSGNSIVVCAVGGSSDVELAANAYERRDDESLGILLGYPACCRQFFNSVWNQQRHIDSTWPMAEGSLTIDERSESLREFEAKVLPECNMLLRWFGLRPVFHLPCCFTCEYSKRVAADIRGVATRIGRKQDIDDLYKCLGWSVRWSALHGIAEIETPVARISTRTDATATKYTVRLTGSTDADVYGAPIGNRFPYRTRVVSTRNVAATVHFPHARHPSAQGASEPWLYQEYGFPSLVSLRKAIGPVARAVVKLAPRSVLHLACKNGALLHRIKELSPSVTVYGVDTQSIRVSHAKELVHSSGTTFWVGEYWDVNLLATLPKVDVTLLMLGRLLELSEEAAQSMVRELGRRGGKVVVYAFDDWTRDHGSLEEMAGKLGLHLICIQRGETSIAEWHMSVIPVV